jgi:hypothetical protein
LHGGKIGSGATARWYTILGNRVVHHQGNPLVHYEGNHLVPFEGNSTVDDDKSIHQVWEGKFPALVLDEKRIKIYHFSLLSELKNVATGFKKNRKSHLYLIDYEFLGESENGLSVIEELGIASKSVLITSRSEDLSIQKRCENLGVKLMPKEVVSFLPISFNHRKLNYV